MPQKTGQTKTHKRVLLVYRRHVREFYRTVRAWQELVRAALGYGVAQQMVLGKPRRTQWEPADYRRVAPEDLAPGLRGVKVSEVIKTITGGLYRPDQDEGGITLGTDPFDAPGGHGCVSRAILAKAKARRPVPSAVLGRVDKIVADLADWHCLRMRGELRIGRMTARIYAEGAKAAAEIAKADVSWDVINRRAVEWAATRSAKLVTEVTEDTKAALRDVIAGGIEDGMSIPAIGQRIMGLTDEEGGALIGLRSDQINALDKFEERLTEQYADEAGVVSAKDQARIDRKVDLAAKEKLAYRAETIARTETAAAVSEGTIQGYAEAGEEQVEFEASADACSECLPRQGQIMDLEEASGEIPVHPNCRCSWRPVARAPLGQQADEAVGEEEGNVEE